MKLVNKIKLDGNTVTFHTFPPAPNVYHVAVDGERCGSLEVAEISMDKHGAFKATWRATVSGTNKPKSALFDGVDDAIQFIVLQYL
jgi:hypothetical protein